MCHDLKRFRTGAIALLFLGLSLAILLPVADAGKTVPAPKVKYEMWLPKNLPLAGEYSILGMNNHGDVLVECRVGYDRTRFTWNTYTDTWVNIDATVLDSPDLVVIASEYLDRARGTVPWSAALEIYFAEESTRNNVNDSGQIAGTVWFTRADGLPTGTHACRWTPATGGNPPELILFDVEGASGCTINNQGDVAGFAGPVAGESPYLWRVVDKSIPLVEERDCAAGLGFAVCPSRAYSVNDDGVVTGSLNVGSTRAFRYTPPPVGSNDPGVFEDLGVVRGGWSAGLAVNKSGQATGNTEATTTGQIHAFLYTSRMADLGTLGQQSLSSRAWDINDSGHVVGFADITSRTYSLFLYTPECGMYDLWKLVVLSDPQLAGKGVTVNNVVNSGSNNYTKPFINDPPGQKFGQICDCIRVSGINNGLSVPFILMPKPQ